MLNAKKKDKEIMSTVAEIIESMKTRFNADAAAGLDEVFQFDIEDADTYHLVIKMATSISLLALMTTQV